MSTISGRVITVDFQAKMPSAVQDPEAVLDYSWNWSGWLPRNPHPRGYGNDTIVGTSWDVTPAGLVLMGETFSDTATTVWVSGGEVRTVYTLTNHIVTRNGLAGDQSLKLRIQDLRR